MSEAFVKECYGFKLAMEELLRNYLPRGSEGLIVNNYFMHTYALLTKQLTMGSSDGDIFPKQHFKKVLVS